VPTELTDAAKLALRGVIHAQADELAEQVVTELRRVLEAREGGTDEGRRLMMQLVFGKAMLLVNTPA
jgi:hypothetical protein